MKLFRTRRTVDVSAVSGTGIVARGIVFDDGLTFLRWFRDPLTSVAIYPNVETLEAVHGHGGTTTIEYLPDASDNDPAMPRDIERDYVLMIAMHAALTWNDAIAEELTWI